MTKNKEDKDLDFFKRCIRPSENLKYEFRAEQNDENKIIIRGYSFLFDSEYTYIDRYGDTWTETIDRNAFDGLDLSDLLLLRDHNYERVLGRRGKNLRFEIDNLGGFFECNLPQTELGKETYELARQEICDQCSFGFYTNKEDIKIDLGNKRIIIMKVRKLVEITITPIPAYKDTVVATLDETRHDVQKIEAGKREKAEAERKKLEAEVKTREEAERQKRIDDLFDKINKGDAK